MARRLTEMAHGGGCGCKLSPGQLRDALARMPALPIDPAILVSGSTFDDAAVVRVRDDLAIVATIDVFTPVVDDPRTFGAIAATNALSDLYAMGATPLFALALAAYPKGGDFDVLGEIMRGGADVALAAGCPVLGGHSIDDPEPKYGLVAIGTVHPDHVLTNAAGRVGDVLVLTKPLGIGAISAGIRAEVAGPEVVAGAIDAMLRTNAAASEAALAAGAVCATDVTGFGLLGHLRELVAASGVGATVDVARVPVLPGALDLIGAGRVPGAAQRNRDAIGQWVDFSPDVGPVAQTLLFDPQTSGGLLVAIAAERLSSLTRELDKRGVSNASIGTLTGEPVGRIGVAP